MKLELNHFKKEMEREYSELKEENKNVSNEMVNMQNTSAINNAKKKQK